MTLEDAITDVTSDLAVRLLMPERLLPLSIAATMGSLELVEFFLSYGLDPNERNADGSTALTEVLDIDVCKALISAGAQVGLEKPVHGRTSIHYAALMGAREVLAKLLTTRGSRESVNRFDQLSYTPLHYAAAGGDLEAIRLLIEAGSDPNLAQEFGGSTPVFKAMSPDKVDALRLLLAKGGTCTERELELAISSYGQDFGTMVRGLHNHFRSGS